MKNLLNPITRKQYWIRVIVSWLLASVVGICADLVLGNGARNLIYIILFIYFIIIQIARYHDANKSGLWTLLNLIPAIGFIVSFIVAGCFPSNYCDNKWTNSTFSE